MVEKAGLADHITCASAGTHGYHVGEPPDLRAQQTAKRRGYDLSAQRARRVAPSDFDEFDLVLVMDSDNLEALKLTRLQPANARTPPELLLEHVATPGPHGVFEVADPYYGSGEGFEIMLDTIEAAAAKLLAMLAAKTG